MSATAQRPDDVIGDEPMAAPCPECGEFDCLLECEEAEGGWKRAWCSSCGTALEEDREPLRWP